MLLPYALTALAVQYSDSVVLGCDGSLSAGFFSKMSSTGDHVTLRFP